MHIFSLVKQNPIQCIEQEACLVLCSTFLLLQTHCSPCEPKIASNSQSWLVLLMPSISEWLHITTEYQSSVSERAAACGSCTACGGIAVHVGSRGHPASPGTDAGLLGWCQAVGPVSCYSALPFAGPMFGQDDLPLPQLVLAHLNSLNVKEKERWGKKLYKWQQLLQLI